MVAKWRRVSFPEVIKCSQIDYGDGCTILCMLNTTELYALNGQI